MKRLYSIERWAVILLASLAIVVTACATSVGSPTAAPSPIALAVSATPAATFTPLPPSLTATNTPSPTGTPTPSPTQTAVPPTATPTLTATPAPVRFAVIGDYGQAGQGSQTVSAMIKSWAVDFIITTGDNNYPNGAAETIDANIGQYYHDFISPYVGDYGQGAELNRFFPSLGNHDWQTEGAQPYLDYFTLPDNERYYDFTWGPVHLFALNSDWREPDGIGQDSLQAAWLQGELAASEAPWKVVYMHAPPYSSGFHGSTPVMRWPYAQWGATAVLAGHDHHYERLTIDGIPYFINGLGGGAQYAIATPLPGSEARFQGEYGAMLVEASQAWLTFQFITRYGEVIDTYQITAVAGNW